MSFLISESAAIAASPITMQAPDLFGSPIDGLSYFEDLISAAEERNLTAHLERVELSPFRFQQWSGKRLTKSFGWTYDFQTGQFTEAEPLPDWLNPVRQKAAIRAGLNADDLVQALIISYPPGAGIGWHRDRPVFEHVLGISLGEPATLRFRRKVQGKFERVSITIAPRSLYHLSGEARHVWEHSISGLSMVRHSITFRSLSAQGTGRSRCVLPAA